jgi:hypothetical protein
MSCCASCSTIFVATGVECFIAAHHRAGKQHDKPDKTHPMTSVSVSAHAMEAGLEANSPRDRAAADPPTGWVIWPGPGRGYIALETDLPSLADALEALWFLRAQRQELDLLNGLADARHA